MTNVASLQPVVPRHELMTTPASIHLRRQMSPRTLCGLWSVDWRVLWETTAHILAERTCLDCRADAAVRIPPVE